MPIDAALKVEGLMQVADLNFLASLAETHTKILEIGSYLGRSTRAIADSTTGFVIAADNFKGPQDVVLTWKQRQGIYEKFLANMGEHVASGRVLPWKTEHAALDTAQAPRPPKYDMVFIDGAHGNEDVKRDILFAYSVLESGGLICGHDYDVNSPGVIMAVTEMVPEFQLGENTRIWWKIVP